MNTYPTSPKDSFQTWGSSASSSYSASPKQLSSSSSWGTVASVHSKTSIGTVTPTVVRDVPIPDDSSWGSQSTLVNSPHSSWPASPSVSYIGSSASSVTLVNAETPVQGLPHLGNPTRGLVALHPALHDGRLAFNFANPPPPPHPSAVQIYSICHSSAFNPCMSYAQINFDGFPHWILRLELPHALTVITILQHVYHYLQEPDMHGLQSGVHAPRNHHQMTYSRDARTQTYCATGQKRIAFLGPRTFFAGLVPSAGANAWTILFTRSSR
ncbi:hypothetical protein CVT26_003793 [Gymnopilus dilepis]|uniref:DUF6699 domain-containing protein n=1 Tax=Gymnopilus dilepis TaxID=231916 RepID=A0A409W1L8_9AGAR|nr:hypothetical protein CVT26_003793 [Gymnopilus dilepis]